MSGAGAELRFFDANARIGLPAGAGAVGPVRMGVSAEELLAAMDRAGIERALVWHAAQRDDDPPAGNALLAEAIGPHERLVGCWSLLPNQTNELGDLDAWFARAAAARVRALRAWPKENRYLLRREVVGALLDRCVAARVPLILSVPQSVTWETVYDLLAELPELTVILADMGSWGSDRFFRPLIARYPNVYVELSGHIIEGGIESFVADYGARRLLFGSGFPEAYHGAMMLALAHAEIAPADKQAIAGANLGRLVAEVRL